ncbi:MotA/TolQ/ExbB proton channel family protein [Methylosinus sporium]|uniref:MotA/TolQ/ExbB proton channel family protein n=1 Tax=Methylosinus sporium TaxID=428 RepID=UPI000D5987AB|nr:MotA/TolQ/ExbB proton channel family protein [Methylosinus sporium]PWB88433.1 flagellar motor protein MotA [Methylocystis sp. MitZ-2018]
MEAISISPLSLFMQAGVVGKIVMIALGVASLWGWAVIIEVAVLTTRLRKATREAQSGGHPPLLAPVMAEAARAARVMVPGESVGERRARIVETTGRAARKLLVATEAGLPNLAVISSVAPFVGLFGTVWGIMTSFVGIADSQDTSLAVVAPGIAEALAATAYGLAAAIPAAIGFNRLGGTLAHTGEALSDHVEEHAITLVGGVESDGARRIAEAA